MGSPPALSSCSTGRTRWIRWEAGTTRIPRRSWCWPPETWTPAKRVCGKGEDLELALALAKDAYQRKPSPEILDTLGWVHFKRGENQQAVALLEKAAAKRPDSPSIRYRLGAALSKAGDEQRARQMLQEALAAGSFPEADEAGRELARLDRR
jgi:Flp pilus assembly protein TadD